MLRLGFDIDGVLADFNTGLIGLLKRDGARIPDGYVPGVWDWPQLELGLSNAYVSIVWEEIKKSHSFWEDLDGLPGIADLAKFKHEPHKIPLEYYYITSRPGNTALEQTKHWLTSWGLFEDGTVIVSPAKGDIAKALKLDFYIDDKLENNLDVFAKTGRRPYLLDYKCNRTESDSQEASMHRVFSVEEYLNDVRRYIEVL